MSSTSTRTRPTDDADAPRERSAPPRASQPSVGSLVSRNLRQFGMVIALAALLVFFQIRTGVALTPGNISNIIQGNAYVLILAVGMVLVIIAGHIDLSVGSVAAFVGVTVALLTQSGVPWFVAVVVGLLVGLAVGAWQGFWVAAVGIPAFIVTLAGMLLFRGLNQVLGKSQTIPVPDQIVYLGTASMPEVGPATGFNNITLLLGLLGVAVLIFFEVRKRRNATRLGAPIAPVWASVVKIALIGGIILLATYLFATAPVGRSFPIPGLILLVLVIIYAFIAARTPLGRHIYAVGGNRAAAQLTGVNVRRVNFFVMTNMGFLAAIAAIVFVGRSTSSGAYDGQGWELDAIAAVFIGGAAVSGGIGTVGRLRHRRSGDRGAEQRPPAARRPERHHPGHQGPGAAARRGAGRVQQEPGQAVDHRAAPAGPAPVRRHGRDHARRDRPAHPARRGRVRRHVVLPQVTRPPARGSPRATHEHPAHRAVPPRRDRYRSR